MKLTATLTISGSVEAMIAVLQSLPDVPVTITGGDIPNASTSTGTGTTVSTPSMVAPTPPVVAPPMMPQATPPSPLPVGSGESAGTAPSADDDDDGPADSNAPATDSKGLPWDERIHSKNKATNADGSWRRRRGIDDATVELVEAELRPAVPLPPTIPAMPQPVPSAQPAPAPQPMPAPPPQAQPAPPALQEAVNAAIAMPTPQPAPAPVAWTPGSLDFLGMMQHLGPKFQERDAAGAPLIHADYLAQLTSEISTAFQLPTPLNAFTDIQNDQAKVDYAVQLFMRDGKWG